MEYEDTMTTTIDDIKKMLEADRDEIIKDKIVGYKTTGFRDVIGDSIALGHEAATSRLLPIIEMYEETLTAIYWHIGEMQNEKIISIKEMCRVLKVISDKYKVQEFLAELTAGGDK